MMNAQRKVKEVRPPVAQTRTRRKKRTINLLALLANRTACVILGAVVVCLVASVYLNACDGFMKKGYTRSELVSHLKDLRKENQELRIAVDGLRQQDRIEAYAIGNGMQRPEQTAYLAPIERPHVAQNPSPIPIR